MAYIGLQPQQKTLGTSTQKISSTGVDYEYTLSRAVSKAADLRVYVNSVAQVPEVDYTATSTHLIFTTQPAAGTDNIVVNYLAGALTTVYIDANSFPVGTTTNPSIRSVDASSTGFYFPSTTSVGVTVSGNTRVTVTDSPLSTSPSTGALRVAGGVGISQDLHVGGAAHVTATTQATNTADGALIVDGGMGVAKDAYIGGALQVAGDFTVAGQFTTTGSDSLSVNDPFIFLANANPGDNLDSGFVSSYFDGTNTRYTGFFRDITDGKYKLFGNLIVQPTTVVDTANVSYKLVDLVVGNLTATNLYGTVAGGTTITEVGNLTALSVSGAINSYNTVTLYSGSAATNTTSGALQVKGGAGIVGNLYAGNVDGTNLTGTSLTVTNVTGTLQTASQPNITTVGTLGSLSVTGNISAANVTTTFGLWGPLRTASQTNITAVGTLGSLAVQGTSTMRAIAAETNNTYNIGASGTTFANGYFTNLYGTLQTAAQTNITSVGTLSGLTVSAAISPNADNTINLGTVSARFATVYGVTFNGVSTTAKYADVAEKYLADAAYEPGTVLHFGGEYEVSQCNIDNCTRVAGIVSTNPAYLMNNDLNGEHVVDLALLGRVPCKVQGTISRGDLLVSAGNGRARAESNPKVGAVIGKALENFDGEHGIIEVVVGRV